MARFAGSGRASPILPYCAAQGWARGWPGVILRRWALRNLMMMIREGHVTLPALQPTLEGPHSLQRYFGAPAERSRQASIEHEVTHKDTNAAAAANVIQGHDFGLGGLQASANRPRSMARKRTESHRP